MNIQLQMFEEQDISSLKEDMKKTKETSENVRKGIFARFNALEKQLTAKYQEQEEKIQQLQDQIKGFICQN